MQITSTPDRLSISVGELRNLWIGLAIIAVLGAQWRLVPGIGGLSTRVFLIGAGVAGLNTLAALGRASVTADRAGGASAKRAADAINAWLAAARA
jgi:hypothetical protein